MAYVRSTFPSDRVSTSGQGKSGLGIEAQRAAVARFTEAEGFEIVAEHVEIETGKGVDALERRPKLAAALAEARRHKCAVVVAKLDRLSRDVAFMLHLYAALAEKERTMISARTIAALQADKDRGVALGNPRLPEVRGKGVEMNKAAADQFAANVLPIIAPMRAEGASLRKIADALNARRIPTARGGTWAATQVADILRRAR